MRCSPHAVNRGRGSSDTALQLAPSAAHRPDGEQRTREQRPLHVSRLRRLKLPARPRRRHEDQARGRGRSARRGVAQSDETAKRDAAHDRVPERLTYRGRVEVLHEQIEAGVGIERHFDARLARQRRGDDPVARAPARRRTAPSIPTVPEFPEPAPAAFPRPRRPSVSQCLPCLQRVLDALERSAARRTG